MNPWQIEGIAPTQPLALEPKPRAVEGGFGKMLKHALAQVNDSQQQADRAVHEVVNGNMGIPEGMMALAEADISLKMLIQVRNKVMDAYREISRM
jgi:flagellar hook-basal body complex protein FliE